MSGLVHLYCGDGKGKTTAAMGLAVRCAGWQERVLVVQLMKQENGGFWSSCRRSPCGKLIPMPSFPFA